MTLLFLSACSDQRLAGPPETSATQAETSDTRERCNGRDDDGDGSVDEGFADDDLDGVADCAEEVCEDLVVQDAGSVVVQGACHSVPPPDPWSMSPLWYVPGIGQVGAMRSMSTPAVGAVRDTDGDGAIGLGDDPVVIAMMLVGEDSRLVAIDGPSGAELWNFSPVGNVAPLIADVTGDQWPEILAVTRDGIVVAIDGDGAVLWQSTEEPLLQGRGVPTVADLDGDGTVEVLVDDLVIEGATGRVLRRLNPPGADPTTPYRAPVVADLDLDGVAEILWAGSIFDADGALLAELGRGAGLDGSTAWMVPVQADADPEAEIAMAGGVYVFDTDGRPLVAMSDTRDALDSVPCVLPGGGGGGRDAVVFTDERAVAFDTNGQQLWEGPETDASVGQGCIAVDVDGDGSREVVTYGGAGVAILDGQLGTLRYRGAATGPSDYATPVFADLDGDGRGELLLSDYPDLGLTAWTNLEGWGGAAPSWPEFNSNGVSIGPYGEVPPAAGPWWNAGAGTRARPAVGPEDLPNLVAVVDDVCAADCPAQPVSLSVHVENIGAVQSSPTRLSIYSMEDGTYVGGADVPALSAGTAADSQILQFRYSAFPTLGVRVVVDDAGDGRGLVDECEEGDNAVESGPVSCR